MNMKYDDKYKVFERNFDAQFLNCILCGFLFTV